MLLTRHVVSACAAFCLLTGYGAGEKRGCLMLAAGTNGVWLGTYPNVEDRTAVVPVLNSGDGVLRISRVVTTCKCLRAAGYPRTLEPGGTGEVSVTVVRNEVTGAFSHVFYIESDDPFNPRVMVRVAGTARPLFLIACDAKTLLGPVPSGLVWTGTYTVAATETGLSLGAPAVQNRGARCEVSIRTNAQERAVYEVTQTVTFEGEGFLESALLFPVIRPGGAESPPVRLAVAAVGRRPLRAVPDRLSLAPSAVPVTHRFLVSVDAGGPAEAGRLRCTAGGNGMSVRVTQAPSRKAFFVEFTFSVGYMEQLAKAGSDTILIRYGDRDRVEIPVFPARP